MENLKLDLNTLKQVKFACNLYSDSSSATHGYRWLCERIIELEKLKNNGCMSYIHIHYSKFCNYKYCPMCGVYLK